MSKLDEQIKSYFSKKEDLKFLLDLVQEQMGELELDHREQVIEQGDSMKQERGKQFVLSLPKFTPSEAWGDPSSEARKQMDMYFRQMGGGRDIKGKIDYLKRLQEPDTRITSPGRIISSLIILESLAACLSSFGSSSAGFVFEGFLAGLLGGRQVADPVGGNLPIEDIIAFQYDEGDPGVPISLKLLSPGTAIKGSYTNLIDAMNTHGEMVYIVAIKKGSDEVSEISIDQFTISRDNVVDLVASRNRDLLALPEGKNIQKQIRYLKSLPWEERYPALQQTAGYTKKGQQISEGSRGTQWHITQKDVTAMESYQQVAEIDISPQMLYRTAEQYLDILGDRIQLLFGAVRDLSENLNVFFTAEDRKAGLARGSEAISNAKVIEKTAAEQLEQEKGTT